MSRIIRVALLVHDHDEAIAFYVGKMGFTLLCDTHFPASEDGKTPARRWVVVLPPGAPEGSTNVVLVKAATEQQVSAVGNQTGGRVFLFLGTGEFAIFSLFLSLLPLCVLFSVYCFLLYLNVRTHTYTRVREREAELTVLYMIHR